MPHEAIQRFIGQLQNSVSYRENAAVRGIIDASVQRLTAMPDNASGALLRQELLTTEAQIVSLLNGDGAAVSENRSEGISTSEAKAILGPDHFFGLDAAKGTFPKLSIPKAVPPIPFSRPELERAKELGLSLRLRIGKVSEEGGPLAPLTGNVASLTMQSMQAQLQEKFNQAGSGKILFGTDSYKSEQFFAADSPRLRWVLVSDGVLPDSENKDYLQQTELIASYLRDHVYRGRTLPRKYAEAIQELIEKKNGIRQLMQSGNWQEAAKQLADLKLNQLTRRTPVEALYDMLVTIQTNGKRHLENRYDWTATLYGSGGCLVNLGGFDAKGVLVDRDDPRDSDGGLGVVLSLGSSES